ncbi:cyclase family protein [Glutamicibacter protophormiae]
MSHYSEQTGVSRLSNLAIDLAEEKIKVIDLTTPLTPQTPALRLPEPFLNLVDLELEEVAAYDNRGPLWSHNNIHIGEHFGTHVDAPVHWISGKEGRDISQLPVKRLVAPAVVIDMSAEVSSNPDFLLEVSHIEAWERIHGSIPHGAWLIYRTGWEQFAHDEKLFLNSDDTGSHTPGISAECAKWLSEKANIVGVGVETVGIDAGKGFDLEPPFPVHHYLLGNDKYGVTSLKNVSSLPVTGAVIIVAPLPFVGGTASPARVLALVE